MKRETDFWYVWLITVICFVVVGIFILMLTSCANRIAGDPFGLLRPEELTTVCHGGAEEMPRTMTFNRTMAEWHLKHHQFDTESACYEM